MYRGEAIPGGPKRPHFHTNLVPAGIVIINPRFDISFWGMEHCIGLLGRRANLPVACLALLERSPPKPRSFSPRTRS
jgi:hypothetical protein